MHLMAAMAYFCIKYSATNEIGRAVKTATPIGEIKEATCVFEARAAADGVVEIMEEEVTLAELEAVRAGMPANSATPTTKRQWNAKAIAKGLSWYSVGFNGSDDDVTSETAMTSRGMAVATSALELDNGPSESSKLLESKSSVEMLEYIIVEELSTLTFSIFLFESLSVKLKVLHRFLRI